MANYIVYMKRKGQLLKGSLFKVKNKRQAMKRKSYMNSLAKDRLKMSRNKIKYTVHIKKL